MNGYDVFSVKVVYAKVESIDRFATIWNMLESIKKETSSARIILSERPHIILAIAKDNLQFAELKKEYERKQLHSTYLLSDLAIGQTDEHGEKWRLVHKFNLNKEL